MRFGTLAILLALGLGFWAIFDALGFFQGAVALVRWALFCLIVVAAVVASIRQPPKQTGDD